MAFHSSSSSIAARQIQADVFVLIFISGELAGQPDVKPLIPRQL